MIRESDDEVARQIVWVQSSLQEFSTTVARSLVPEGFERYVILAHPEQVSKGEAGTLDSADTLPLEGELAAPTLATLRATFDGIDECWYIAVWDGWNVELDIEDRTVARLDLPSRSYDVMSGTVEDLAPLPLRDPSEPFSFLRYTTPSIAWTANRRLFLATEVDFRWTAIGCDAPTARRLLDTESLDAVAVEPDRTLRSLF